MGWEEWGGQQENQDRRRQGDAEFDDDPPPPIPPKLFLDDEFDDDPPPPIPPKLFLDDEDYSFPIPHMKLPKSRGPQQTGKIPSSQWQTILVLLNGCGGKLWTYVTKAEKFHLLPIYLAFKRRWLRTRWKIWRIRAWGMLWGSRRREGRDRRSRKGEVGGRGVEVRMKAWGMKAEEVVHGWPSLIVFMGSSL